MKKYVIPILISLSLLTIVFSFFAPMLFIQKSTENIAETNWEIMNPFIAIAGVFGTFLAFYMQYEANKSLKSELEAQEDENTIRRIEAQFYEMIRLHKENVNEMELEITYRVSKINESIFDSLSGPSTEKTDYPRYSIVKGRDCFRYFCNEFAIAYEGYISYMKVTKNGNFKPSIPYKVFFHGLDSISEFEDFKKVLIDWKKEFQSKFLDNVTGQTNFYTVPVIVRYPLFEGHENKLGHYYRHLFQTIKFITEEKHLVYNQKKKYLKIIRAQLSNYEQAMIFYNDVCFSYGWEKEFKLFSEYRMIHNLYEETLIQDKFFLDQYQYLKNMIKNSQGDFIFESQEHNRNVGN